MSIPLSNAIARIKIHIDDHPNETQEALDETVHDAVMQLKSEQLNEHERETERERLLQQWEQEISDINNEGWESQVTFLFKNGFFSILESNI